MIKTVYSWMAACAVLAVSPQVFADTDAAINAFQQDPAVTAAIQAAVESQRAGGTLTVTTLTPTAVLLRSGSGIVGVTSTYLVTEQITSSAVNAQSAVVAAKASQIGAPNNITVSLLTPEQLAAILQVISPRVADGTLIPIDAIPVFDALESLHPRTGGGDILSFSTTDITCQASATFGPPPTFGAPPKIEAWSCQLLDANNGGAPLSDVHTVISAAIATALLNVLVPTGPGEIGGKFTRKIRAKTLACFGAPAFPRPGPRPGPRPAPNCRVTGVELY